MEPITCTACGCLCDDIAIEIQGGRLTEIGRACDVGRDWFLVDRPALDGGSVALAGGRPAEVEPALEAAAALLRAAKSPVVLGLSRSTNETVAAALEIADQIGAAVEPGDPGASLPRLLAYQRVGRVSATLGEVKNRADVVVFWGADPIVSHPRHWERYSVEPRGRFVPEGRAGRTVIVADHQRTATAAQADLFVQIRAEAQFEVLWVLRALVRGVELDPERVKQVTGSSLADLGPLVERLKSARYGAWFSGLRLNRGPITRASATIEAANGLVRDLNRQTRFVILGLGEPGNPHGAETVLTWQTGFSAGVDLGPGYPDSLPRVTSSSDRLARGEADAALIVGALSTDALEPEARNHLERIPVVVIAPPEVSFRFEVAVRLFVATPGIDAGGTITRADGVSLPLRAIRPAVLPTERDWLDALGKKLSLIPAQTLFSSGTVA